VYDDRYYAPPPRYGGWSIFDPYYSWGVGRCANPWLSGGAGCHESTGPVGGKQPNEPQQQQQPAMASVALAVVLASLVAGLVAGGAVALMQRKR
jgi:hypothetical protein